MKDEMWRSLLGFTEGLILLKLACYLKVKFLRLWIPWSVKGV